ncbi:hypothetical protein, partial [Anditalea andensis]|uniref:hypothetical protein n=1 Tax=Anditalea andensis TaxID=1048983 RepID=UPI00196A00F0
FPNDAVRSLLGSESTSAHMLYTCDPFRVGRIIRAVSIYLRQLQLQTDILGTDPEGIKCL